MRYTWNIAPPPSSVGLLALVAFCGCLAGNSWEGRGEPEVELGDSVGESAERLDVRLDADAGVVHVHARRWAAEASVETRVQDGRWKYHYRPWDDLGELIIAPIGLALYPFITLFEGDNGHCRVHDTAHLFSTLERLFTMMVPGVVHHQFASETSESASHPRTTYGIRSSARPLSVADADVRIETLAGVELSRKITRNGGRISFRLAEFADELSAQGTGDSPELRVRWGESSTPLRIPPTILRDRLSSARLREEARRALREGRVADAEALVRKIRLRDGGPGRIETLQLHGEILLAADRTDEAERALRGVLLLASVESPSAKAAREQLQVLETQRRR